MAYSMAIIGYGGMAGYHREMLEKKITEIKVTGAYDIRPEAIEKIKADKLKCYSSPEELYADKSVDLVLVATPNDTHKQYAIACLESGKMVICEKPVAMSSAELEEIIAVSEKTGKFFTVHQNRRWDSDFLTIQKVISDCGLGKPFVIESRVQGSRQYLHGWRGYRINGGGMVYDWGVHLIDQMLMMIPGRVVSVSAHLHSLYTKEVDDNFTAFFRFDSGLSFLVNVANHCFAPQPRWHMSCENGSAVIDNWDVEGKVVRLNQSKADMGWDEVIVYTSAGPTRSMAPRPKETLEDLPLPVVKGEWMEYYKNIALCLAGKAEPIVKPSQALRVMRLLELVFEADKIGAMVKCDL